MAPAESVVSVTAVPSRTQEESSAPRDKLSVSVRPSCFDGVSLHY